MVRNPYDDFLLRSAKQGQTVKSLWDQGLYGFVGGTKTTSRDTPIASKASERYPTVHGITGQPAAYGSRSPQLYRFPNTFDAGDTHTLLMHSGVVDKYDIGRYTDGTTDGIREGGTTWFNSFSRAGFIDPFNEITKTREYIFFTKPDLNILSGSRVQSELSNNFFMVECAERYPEVIHQLQLSADSGYKRLALSPLLSNAVQGSLELPGLSADSIETARNIYGTSISYRGTSYKSDQAHEFTLDFKDDKWLNVYMYFKIYDEYERIKASGNVSPKEDYILNKILHDQIAIYKFIVAEDGMTILYWARAMGCYPTGAPRDSMSNLGPETTFSVSFYSQFVSDMDPRILYDFNRITSGSRRDTMRMYDEANHRVDGTWASCPFVMMRGNGNYRERHAKYFLMWAA